MKQVQRVVTLALALFLIGLPAVTMAQSSPSSPAAPAAPGADKPTSPALDKPAPPSASPATTPPSGSSVGKSPSATPMSAADCQNNGWQKFGLKSEAECSAKVKK